MVTKFFVRFKFLLIVVISACLPTNAHAIDYAKLYAQVSPSVAKISTQTFSITKAGIVVEPGVGSGFLVEPDLVMTAAHVVSDVDMVRVNFTEDVAINATVVALLENSDVALLKLDTPQENPIVARLGDSSATRIGSPVFVVGAPYGIEQTLSVGHLSGRMQRGESELGEPIEFLQTDTAINPGNSGGPMFNAEGEVIGVVSFILSKSGGFDGIGFASAAFPAHKALQSSSGFVAGFDGINLSRKLKRALSLPNDGILVQRVVSESVADSLGLKAGSIPAQIGSQELLLGGDIILSIDCDACAESKNTLAINDVADQLSTDQAIVVTVYREGQSIELTRERNENPVVDISELSYYHTEL